MECGDCTLCCKLLDISWMNSPVDEYCKECNIGVGCKIFDNIPKKCLEFSCGYNQMKKMSVGLRPDKCHVIFEKVADDIFIGLLDPENEMTDIAARQINSFLKEGFSVFLTKPKEEIPIIYVTPGMDGGEVYHRVQEIIKDRNGST